MKKLSEYNAKYYNAILVKILQGCIPGELHYTHHFHFLNISAFYGDRNLLRQCLRTLEAKGYLINHILGFNIHQWTITEKGIQYVADHDPLNPKPL